MIRDAPIEEMDCSIGVTGVSRIMRHHADRGALAVQFTEQFHHGLSISRIQVARGLIRKQNGRLAAQRSSDGDALLLAARELRRIMVHPMRHLYFFQRFFDAFLNHIKRISTDVFSIWRTTLFCRTSTSCTIFVGGATPLPTNLGLRAPGPTWCKI